MKKNEVNNALCNNKSTKVVLNLLDNEMLIDRNPKQNNNLKKIKAIRTSFKNENEINELVYEMVNDKDKLLFDNNSENVFDRFIIFQNDTGLVCIAVHENQQIENEIIGYLEIMDIKTNEYCFVSRELSTNLEIVVDTMEANGKGFAFGQVCFNGTFIADGMERELYRVEIREISKRPEKSLVDRLKDRRSQLR